MSKKLKVAVIGAGRMGQYHVGVYSEMIGVDLYAVVDVDPDRGKEVAARYGAKHITDYRDLFGVVDLVSIAIPTSQHYAVTKECLEAELHCLVEKPVTNNLKQAEELFSLADKKNLALHVGHVERFNGAVQELHKVVSNPLFIESRRLGPFDPRIQDDGVVLDVMIHDIDIIMNLVASPCVNMGVMGSSVFTQKEDIVNVQLQFENGCIASILASRATQKKIRTLAVTQEKEYIFLDYTQQDILVHRRASSQHELTQKELKYRQEALIERIFVHRDNPLKLELQHLVDCASNGAKRHTSVKNELQSLEIALKVLDHLTPVRKKLAVI